MKINTNFRKDKGSDERLNVLFSMQNQGIKEYSLNSSFKIVLFILLLLFNIIFISAASTIQNIQCSFKTFTNGGWGANCHGSNAGCYLESNFSKAFPNGLIIGCERKLRLTSASAVNDFLPSSGSINTLPVGTTINPGQTYANTFAGQLVALTLNVRFDEYDTSFAPASGRLGSLVIAQGLFSGWTVNRFLDSANRVIGSCLTVYSMSDWVQTATLINQNFDNGTVDMGFLMCLEPLQLSLAIQSTIKCHGDSMGAIFSYVSGGIQPYFYHWSNNYNSQNIFGLSAGWYSLVVTDAMGQTISKDIILTQPSSLILSFTTSNVSCHGGQDGMATIQVSGGTIPYSVEWSNGSTSSQLNNLIAGIYNVNILDSNGCHVVDSVKIAQPESLSASFTTSNVSCHGGQDGRATIQVSGGTIPYSVEWSNGSTSSNLNSLIAGMYVVNVIDSNGCHVVDFVKIAQPESLSASFTTSNVSCYGGQDGRTTIQVSGGTIPYSVEWSNGSTSSNLNSLIAGMYVVNVTDSNGCHVVDSVKIAQPESLSASFTTSNVSCHGGQDGRTTIQVSGGTIPYSVEWSIGSTSSQLNNLTAGIYSVNILDSNGCNLMDSVLISQPDPLALVIKKTDVACYGGTGEIKPMATGGASPYNYELGGNLYPIQSVVSKPVGNWEVHASDANGCLVNGFVSISLLSCSEFTTVTQGGWHAKCSGENWGCMLDHYFSTFFPSGLIIGSNGRFLKLTSALAIHNFLPSSGMPKSLNIGTLLNPTSSTLKNTLAGQTVSLTLNCILDANLSSFANATTLLQDLIIASGMFEGWSVGQLLLEANKALGGISIYSFSDLSSILDKLNSNYDNGLVNNGLLACPCSQQNILFKSFQGENDIDKADFETKLSVSPNPIKTNATMKIVVKAATHVTLDILSMSGQLIKRLLDSDLGEESTSILEMQAEELNAGMYMLRMQTGNSLDTKRIVVVK